MDRHEAGHITTSRTHNTTNIAPLETRVSQHRREGNAMAAGANRAEAITALQTFVDWNTNVTGFQNADTTSHTPGGTFDTNDALTADFYFDAGPRRVGGTDFAHYVDAP